MPGPKPCPPGCTCGHHNRPKMTPEESRARRTEVMRRWRAENPERDRANWQRNRSNPQVRARMRSLDRSRQPLVRVRRHGLTPERFAVLLQEQDCRCYLCNEPLDLERPRATHIDHDHSCCRGRSSCGDCIRGIACAGCNKAIARYGDSPERMEQAAMALRAANARVAERLARRAVQGELPVNVVPIRRETESA